MNDLDIKYKTIQNSSNKVKHINLLCCVDHFVFQKFHESNISKEKTFPKIGILRKVTIYHPHFHFHVSNLHASSNCAYCQP